MNTGRRATLDGEAFFGPASTENAFVQWPVAQMARLHLVASISAMDAQTELAWLAEQALPGDAIAKQAVSRLPWEPSPGFSRSSISLAYSRSWD